MRLNAEEYRRGVASWNATPPARLRTSTTPTNEAVRQWSEPLTDPLGSKVLSPENSFHQVRHEPIDAAAASPPFPIRWEHLNPNEIVETEVWDTVGGSRAYFRLGHIHNYGTFHRLVVAPTRYLNWDDNAVIRVGDSRVRLVTGKAVGVSAPPLDKITVEGTTITLVREAPERTDGVIVTLTGKPGGTLAGVTASITGAVSEDVEREGRFLEIVAPGTTLNEAQLRAFAVLGLVALC